MKARPPVISVLMCVYNGERFLREAVESILRQTLADFEFIIVDDASTDTTAWILDRYRDARIVRLMNSENKGLTESLNRGLQAARARYVARMDADDISEPWRLEKQLAFIQGHSEISVLGGAATQIDAGGHVIGKSKAFSGELFPWVLHFGNKLNHSSVMARRDHLAAVGGYDPHYLYAQDFELWFRLVKARRQFHILDDAVLRRRVTEQQVTCQHREAQRQAAESVIARYLEWRLGGQLDSLQLSALLKMSRGLDPLNQIETVSVMQLLTTILSLAEASLDQDVRSLRQLFAEELQCCATLQSRARCAPTISLLLTAAKLNPWIMLQADCWKIVARKSFPAIVRH